MLVVMRIFEEMGLDLFQVRERGGAGGDQVAQVVMVVVVVGCWESGGEDGLRHSRHRPNMLANLVVVVVMMMTTINYLVIPFFFSFLLGIIFLLGLMYHRHRHTAQYHSRSGERLEIYK